MNDLFKTELFNLLMNNSQQVTNHEMQQAYENFIVEMTFLNQSDKDYQLIYRSLNLTRIEFQSLQAQIWYEQGEKCIKKSLFAKSYLCN